MDFRTPAYAKVKPITSRSGCKQASKNRQHLAVAQALLNAQNTIEATHAAMQMQSTIDGYTAAINAWYRGQETR